MAPLTNTVARWSISVGSPFTMTMGTLRRAARGTRGAAPRVIGTRATTVHSRPVMDGEPFETLSILRGLGLSTLIIDYRGYGRSEGTPSEDGVYRDAEAAWRHVTEVRKRPADRVVIWAEDLR